MKRRLGTSMPIDVSAALKEKGFDAETGASDVQRRSRLELESGIRR
jgi:hypothetical protein